MDQQHHDHDIQIAMQIQAGLVADGEPDTDGTLLKAMLAWRFARLVQEQGVLAFVKPKQEPEREIYLRGRLMPRKTAFAVNVAIHTADLPRALDVEESLFLRARNSGPLSLDAIL